MYIAILRGTPELMLLLLLFCGVFARTGPKQKMHLRMKKIREDDLS